MLSAPVNLTVYGAIPSVPPWKGTVNLIWSAVGPVVPVESISLANEPVHNPELAWPSWSSTLNGPATFNSITSGKGLKKFSLSFPPPAAFSFPFHPKNPLVS